jgi:hypothetical protein
MEVSSWIWFENALLSVIPYQQGACQGPISPVYEEKLFLYQSFEWAV